MCVCVTDAIFCHSSTPPSHPYYYYNTPPPSWTHPVQRSHKGRMGGCSTPGSAGGGGGNKRRAASRWQPSNFLSRLSEAPIAAIDRTCLRDLCLCLWDVWQEKPKQSEGGGVKLEEVQAKMKGSDGEVINTRRED